MKNSKKCLHCQSTVENKYSIFCSVLCGTEYKKTQKINAWFAGTWDGTVQTGLSQTVRTYLISQANGKCSKCGWNKINPALGYCPLEINHIDGNYQNNLPNNLEVVCPNCHSLEPTYKRLNQSGRGYRATYNQFALVDKKESQFSWRLFCLCGKSKDRNAEKCIDCHRGDQKLQVTGKYPSLEIMIARVTEVGYSQYGRELGVSDNAIRKHFRRNDIDPLPKKM